MKLTLVCDQTQNAASRQLLDFVLDRKDKENIVVITPENATLWAEEYLATNAKSGAVSGLVVTNVTRLCQIVFPSESFVSNQMSQMLIARALQENKLVAYKNPSKHFGLAAAMHNMIKLFSQSGIEPSDLSNNSNSKSIEQKLIDLRVVWESYLSMLPKGSNDVTSKTTKLIKKLNLLNGWHVLFYKNY